MPIPFWKNMRMVWSALIDHQQANDAAVAFISDLAYILMQFFIRRVLRCS